MILSTPEKRAQPRVPFGALVEGGWLAAGDTLFDKTKSVQARVCADGSLVTDKAQKGSIHGLGAALQNQPSCNGWQYWHVTRDGKDVSIDQLRSEYRKSMQSD